MNTLRPYADAIMGAGALAALAFVVAKTPDHLRNQTALSFLNAGDTSVDHRKKLEEEYTQRLEAQKLEVAQQIISSCHEQLNSCLGKVITPYGGSCKRFVQMDTMKFYDSLIPRQADYLFNADPEKNECALQVQNQIIKCHDEAVRCLEVPLRK